MEEVELVTFICLFVMNVQSESLIRDLYLSVGVMKAKAEESTRLAYTSSSFGRPFFFSFGAGKRIMYGCDLGKVRGQEKCDTGLHGASSELNSKSPPLMTKAGAGGACILVVLLLASSASCGNVHSHR